MNNPVRALVFDRAGMLCAGGDFTVAGGVGASRVAKWNGSSWSALGSGISNGSVFALTFDNAGNLYVGGAFSLAVASVQGDRQVGRQQLVAIRVRHEYWRLGAGV